MKETLCYLLICLIVASSWISPALVLNYYDIPQDTREFGQFYALGGILHFVPLGFAIKAYMKA